jgi:hypothetical protein
VKADWWVAWRVVSAPLEVIGGLGDSQPEQAPIGEIETVGLASSRHWIFFIAQVRAGFNFNGDQGRADTRLLATSGKSNG